jgi:hypothetical protein
MSKFGKDGKQSKWQQSFAAAFSGKKLKLKSKKESEEERRKKQRERERKYLESLED